MSFVCTQFKCQFYFTLSGAITLSNSGAGSDGNEGVIRIHQSSSVSGSSPLDCLKSYQGHLLERVLPLYRDAVDVYFGPGWLCLITLSYWWSPLVSIFPILPVPLPILWCLYRAHRSKLVSPSLSCSFIIIIIIIKKEYLLKIIWLCMNY